MTGESYPSVDLSHLVEIEQRKYLPRVEEDYAEFERLREQVRPLVPPTSTCGQEPSSAPWWAQPKESLAHWYSLTPGPC